MDVMNFNRMFHFFIKNGMNGLSLLSSRRWSDVCIIRDGGITCYTFGFPSSYNYSGHLVVKKLMFYRVGVVGLMCSRLKSRVLI